MTRPRSDHATPDAACAAFDLEEIDEVFFTPGHSQLIAKRICAGCPLVEACLAMTLDQERGLPTYSRFGVFGGKTPGERRALDPGKVCATCGTPLGRALADRCPPCARARRHEMQMRWRQAARTA